MKLAIVSTTINGEKGYLPFDRLAKKSNFSEISFVISGDLKSKPFDATVFKNKVEYLDPQAQARFKCSEAIGWNKIMRRNIALLRAIELQPDYILMIDDDNQPTKDYFDLWYNIITTNKTKSVLRPAKKTDVPWHNYLKTSDARINMYPRGFPIVFRDIDSTLKKTKEKIKSQQVGVYQGISLEDADIDAMTRIIYPDSIYSIKEKNYFLQNVWSPYNTQNTLFSKEIFPLAFVWPFCGRYDDIYSSYVWQQFLFNKNMYIHVGDAINKQNRGIRNNLKDFSNEVEGYLHAHEVCQEIRSITEKDPIKFIEKLSQSENEIIKRQREFMEAYLKDLKIILS